MFLRETCARTRVQNYQRFWIRYEGMVYEYHMGNTREWKVRGVGAQLVIIIIIVLVVVLVI